MSQTQQDHAALTLKTLRQAWKTQGLPRTPFETLSKARLIDRLLCVVQDQEPDEPADVLDLVVYALTGRGVRSVTLQANNHRVTSNFIASMLEDISAGSGTTVIAGLRAQHDEDGPGWLHGGWTLR